MTSRSSLALFVALALASPAYANHADPFVVDGDDTSFVPVLRCNGGTVTGNTFTFTRDLGETAAGARWSGVAGAGSTTRR